MVKLKVDPVFCKGCLLCTKACPMGLIIQGGEFNEFGCYTVRVERIERCSGCGLCVCVCPDVAITIWK